MSTSTFPPEVWSAIEACLPLCKALGEGRYAVSVGGSYGKSPFDRGSDLDLRLFTERRLPTPEANAKAYAHLQSAIDRWRDRGVVIDGCWVRTIDEIDQALDLWCQGTAQPEPLVWTIWGYHLPTDIYHQKVIEDPDGVLAAWKARLATYPPRLQHTLLKQHLNSIRYWRDDDHYRRKLERQDRVFLAGLTSRLVHDLLRILFALNETYYVGDGNNLDIVQRFEHLPDRFVARVNAVLYPGEGADALTRQYRQLIALIDDTDALARRMSGPAPPIPKEKR